MKLILKNGQSPGDIVMLTAAVRDLHRCHPNRFLTDVRTPCAQMWENNPYITPIDDADPEAKIIHCEYPLIHASNSGPWHFVHGFTKFLSQTLRLPLAPTEFRGDIHLSLDELGWVSQVEEIVGRDVPYWIVAAGGKMDFTIKWWSSARFQRVVDHYRDRLLFVQVGEGGHNHPALRGVLDLRGKTDLRQLIRLVYNSQGVLSPVTLLMHLAAAVQSKQPGPRNRPCVVVAGGREPPQWEAYPHHQFIHTIGTLPCCDNGGCWKARTYPMKDGDEKDSVDHLCSNVVLDRYINRQVLATVTSGTSAPVNAMYIDEGNWRHLLPKCMDFITADDVINRIDYYLAGGAVRQMDRVDVGLVREHIEIGD